MKKTLFSYYCFIMLFLSLVCGYAGEETPLAGSLHPLRDEVISATDVVIGKFLVVKARDTFSSMMGAEYQGQITILQTLKGNESGSLEVGFPVIRGGKNKEAEPNLNDTYIIILVQHQVIRKLLPATDANIAKVKALIAAAPASK